MESRDFPVTLLAEGNDANALIRRGEVHPFHHERMHLTCRVFSPLTPHLPKVQKVPLFLYELLCIDLMTVQFDKQVPGLGGLAVDDICLREFDVMNQNVSCLSERDNFI